MSPQFRASVPGQSNDLKHADEKIVLHAQVDNVLKEDTAAVGLATSTAQRSTERMDLQSVEGASLDRALHALDISADTEEVRPLLPFLQLPVHCAMRQYFHTWGACHGMTHFRCSCCTLQSLNAL